MKHLKEIFVLGLLGVVIGLAVVGKAVAQVPQGAGIAVDLANRFISLRPNEAGQTYALMANNPGQAFDILQAYLTFQIGDGQATSSAPSITSVDVITGTPFASLAANERVLSDSQVTPQFRSVDISVDLENAFGTTVTIPSGVFRLATITFDTTALDLGMWDFNMMGVNSDLGIDTYFTLSDFNTYSPIISAGLQTLTVVPEVEDMATLSGVGLLGWMAWRRRRSGVRIPAN